VRARVQEDFMGSNFDIVHAHDWLAAKCIVQA
jgi:glycogen synthase